MTTLNNVEVMTTFARGCVSVYENWQAETPAFHERRVQDLLSAACRSASLPDFSFAFVDLGNGGGELDQNAWRLRINSQHTNSHVLPQYLFKWLCGILYHEARHGEQWVRCAQGVLAGDFVIPGAPNTQVATVATWMRLPNAVVLHAHATQARYDALKNSQPVRSWFDSVWGAQRGHRGTVLGRPNIMVSGTADNHAYINLPEEVDAYATQYAMEAILDPLLTATAQRQVEDKRPVAELRTGHEQSASGSVPRTFADQLQDKAKGLRHTGGRLDQREQAQQLRTQHQQFAAQSRVAQTSQAPNINLGTSVRNMTADHQAMAAASRQVVSNANPDDPMSRSRIAGLASLFEKRN